MDRILDAGFKQPAGENILIQSRSLEPASRLSRRRSTTSSRASRGSQTSERPLAARPGNAGQIAKDGRAVLVEFDDPRRQGEGRRQDRPGPRRGRRRTTRPSGLLHRRVRRCERGEGGQTAYRGRPGEGGDALAPDHADHPAAHFRRARGGRHSAAARADGGVRDVRADRAPQPCAAGGERGAPRWCS